MLVRGAAASDAAPTEALPVDIITVTRILPDDRGRARAPPKVETPKPLVEKVDEPKPVEDPAAKVAEKKEVKAARRAAAGAGNQAGRGRSRSKKQAETPSPTRSPTRSKKDEAKKPEPKNGGRQRRRRRRKKPAPPAAEVRPQAGRGAARQARCRTQAGRRRRDPQQFGLARRAERSTRRRLSQSELDALRARLAQLLEHPPAGAQDPQELVVLIRVQLKPDGTLAAPPMVLDQRQSSAVRRRPRQRHSRALPRPAVRHAQARALRAMERHRDHLRSARHDPRLTPTAVVQEDRP